ncbi:MAG: SurA N-terminal domain-containing protein, partial [Myxococcota bacterium]|nr:SurA N-terminal domain-containing protein [Myxococcota bacterium]
MKIRGLVLALGLLMAFGCQNAANNAPAEELVAKVNGEGITKSSFDTAVERNMARYKGKGQKLPPGIEQRIKESVLRRLIDDAVIRAKAGELSVVVSEQDVEQKFTEHKQRFRTESAFQDYLKRSNNTIELMKTDLKRNMLRDMVVEKLSGSIEVPDAEVQKYFDDNKARFVEKEQIKASRILVRLTNGSNAGEKKSA